MTANLLSIEIIGPADECGEDQSLVNEMLHERNSRESLSLIINGLLHAGDWISYTQNNYFDFIEELRL